MDLKSFIAQTLNEITMGVTNAQLALKDISTGNLQGYGPAINPKTTNPSDAIKTVDFDIAVTVTDTVSGSASGKAGISVVGLNAGIQQESSNSKVSRIKFQVPIRFGYLHG